MEKGNVVGRGDAVFVLVQGKNPNFLGKNTLGMVDLETFEYSDLALTPADLTIEFYKANLTLIAKSLEEYYTTINGLYMDDTGFILGE